MLTAIKTPCIGVCSTGLGDSVCRGCKRFAHEVIHWNSYKSDERDAIFKRLESLLSRVVETRLTVVDSNVLKQQLLLHDVRVNPRLNTKCMAYEAIRAFGAQLPDLKVIGCRINTAWLQMTIAELKESIENNFYELSCAHYQRYFPGHI